LNLRPPGYEVVSRANRSHFGSDLCFLPPFARRIFHCFRPALPVFFGFWVKTGSRNHIAQTDRVHAEGRRRQAARRCRQWPVWHGEGGSPPVCTHRRWQSLVFWRSPSTCLIHEIRIYRFFVFRLPDARVVRRCLRFQKIRHILCKRPHGLHSFQVSLRVFCRIAMHLIPILRAYHMHIGHQEILVQSFKGCGSAAPSA